MQFWSWMLVMCLASAVTARPEGRPPPSVEITRAVAGGGPNAVKDEQPPKDAAILEQPKLDDDNIKPMAEALKPVLASIADAKEQEAVKEQEKQQGEEEEEAVQALPVPIEPDVMPPDDSKVFPEGALRSPMLAAEATADASRVIGEKPELPLIPQEQPSKAEKPADKDDEKKEKAGSRLARAYLPAEARGADNEGLELTLAPDTLLVPYYGGAKGQYLIVAKPVTAADLKKADKNKKNNNNKKKKKPAAVKPGHKEEEDEDDVGEETNEEKPPPPPPASDSSDTVTIAQPPPNASMAEARPVGIAVAGEGGVASARPIGTAVVGPGGLAVARPIATAIAGIQGAEYLVTSGAQPQLGPSPFVYPLGPAFASPLGAPIPSMYAGVNPLGQPLAHPGPQWLVYPPPPPPPLPFPYF